MVSLVLTLLRSLAATLQTRRHLVLENLALRHQLLVLHRISPQVRVEYVDYYHQSRTHRSLAQDCPVPRPTRTPDQGSVVEFPLVGGLHHLYTR